MVWPAFEEVAFDGPVATIAPSCCVEGPECAHKIARKARPHSTAAKHSTVRPAHAPWGRVAPCVPVRDLLRQFAGHTDRSPVRHSVHRPAKVAAKTTARLQRRWPSSLRRLLRRCSWRLQLARRYAGCDLGLGHARVDLGAGNDGLQLGFNRGGRDLGLGPSARRAIRQVTGWHRWGGWRGGLGCWQAHHVLHARWCGRQSIRRIRGIGIQRIGIQEDRHPSGSASKRWAGGVPEAAGHADCRSMGCTLWSPHDSFGNHSVLRAGGR